MNAHSSEENKKTVEGIDVDKNGIRDDVQVWIDSEYPLSLRANTNKALKQYSKYLQLALVNSSNQTIAKLNKVKTLEALTCLHWILGINSASVVRKNLKSKFLNTKERIMANSKVEAYFHGDGVPESIRNTAEGQEYLLCEFPASKENGVSK